MGKPDVAERARTHADPEGGPEGAGNVASPPPGGPIEVTVLISAYDEGPLLLEAIESVLAQEGDADAPAPPFEIVIAHDRGANAETLRAIEHARMRYPGVRVFENAKRKGIGGTRNTGIARARGRWIAFLDGDDLWFPRALAYRWRALSRAPEAGWAAGDFLRGPARDRADDPAGFTRGNPRLRVLFGRAASEGDLDTAETESLRLQRPVAEFCEASLCWTGMVMVRRDLLERAGGFHERLARGEDVHLWIRLAASSDLIFVPRPLALYRTRPSTLVRRGLSVRGWDIVGTLDLLRRPSLWRWFPDFGSRLIRMMNEQAADLRSRRRFAKAVVWSCASALCFPFQTRAWRTIAGSLLRRA